MREGREEGGREEGRGCRRGRDGGRGGELREEACVNDFGRFVHIGDVHCKDPFTKGELNPPGDDDLAASHRR